MTADLPSLHSVAHCFLQLKPARTSSLHHFPPARLTTSETWHRFFNSSQGALRSILNVTLGYKQLKPKSRGSSGQELYCFYRVPSTHGGSKTLVIQPQGTDNPLLTCKIKFKKTLKNKIKP